jgi:hypothetical protein
MTPDEYPSRNTSRLPFRRATNGYHLSRRGAVEQLARQRNERAGEGNERHAP